MNGLGVVSFYDNKQQLVWLNEQFLSLSWNRKMLAHSHAPALFQQNTFQLLLLSVLH